MSGARQRAKRARLRAPRRSQVGSGGGISSRAREARAGDASLDRALSSPARRRPAGAPPVQDARGRAVIASRPGLPEPD